MIFPISFSMIFNIFGPEEGSKKAGINTAVQTIAFIVGPIIGGVLASFD